MSGAERREWTVSGMDCAACTVKVTKAVERLPGVRDVKVALMSERLSLDLEPARTDPTEIETIVKRLGYGIAQRGATSERKPLDAADKPLSHGHDCDGHDREHDHDGTPPDEGRRSRQELVSDRQGPAGDLHRRLAGPGLGVRASDLGGLRLLGLCPRLRDRGRPGGQARLRGRSPRPAFHHRKPDDHCSRRRLIYRRSRGSGTCRVSFCSGRGTGRRGRWQGTRRYPSAGQFGAQDRASGNRRQDPRSPGRPASNWPARFGTSRRPDPLRRRDFRGH